MTDWPTISSLATAGGTLVLAAATYSAVRSSNRSNRTAERALQAGLRPVLFPSRVDDPVQKIRWGDDHWAKLEGGRANVELVGDVIYLAASLRNVGAGIAVLHGWRAGGNDDNRATGHPPTEAFRPQGRDLYVPAGDLSFWQAAYREGTEAGRDEVVDAIKNRQPITVDLLYGDHEGGQRAVSRFTLVPRPWGDEADATTWLCSVVRHWNLDRPDPR